MKIAPAALAASATCLLAACASAPPPEAANAVVRTRAPVHYKSTIENYYALISAPDLKANQEREFGPPLPGNCAMAGRNESGHLGWVVPVQTKTKSSDSRVTIVTQFFWFSNEILRGQTRRVELCP